MISWLRRWGLINPWVWMFAITSWLQVFRGSRLDTVIFLSSTVIVWASASGVLGNTMRDRIKVKRPTIFFVVFFFTVALAVFPRHSYQHGILILVLLPLVLRLVWYRDSGRKEKADQRMNRSKLVWLILCLGITAWEFMANILGQLVGSLHVYPTLSVLIDPWLDTQLGQAAFVVLWFATGIGFLGLWRHR